ncbi:MAG: DUF3048 domain-containing protein, partial [Candidatus Fimenecus sp.]
ICSIIMALSLIMLSFAACGKKPTYGEGDGSTQPTAEPTTEPQQELPANVSALTGLPVSDSAVGTRPIAIMVENSPEARPQWGLSTPDVVIEGLVEGGITRMMWIYSDVTQIPKVGPVRSARHDYVEIADGMNAIYTHWGGSNQAYDYIKSIGMVDIDGSKLGTNSPLNSSTTDKYYFFKDNTRTTSTEHRGFTDGEHLAAAIAKKGIETKATGTDWAPFDIVVDGIRVPFGEETGSCSEITANFSNANKGAYRYTFKYNAEKKLYYKYNNGEVLKDGNNGQEVSFTNIIIMYANVDGYQTTNENDKKLREWDLTSGDAVYVSMGSGESITWKKESKTAPLKFYGKDGKELKINKGQTWIGVVPEANRTSDSLKTTIVK